VNSGVTAKLIAGPGAFDALSRLGIAAGTLANAGTSSSSSTSSTSSTQAFGLGLSSNMNISTSTSAGAVRAQLLNVLSAIQKAYQTTNAPAASTTTNTQSGGTVSAYAQSQLANYSLALNVLSYGSTSSSTGLIG